MPNLLNRSLINAQGELESYGLLLGKIEYVPDLQQNAVLKQRVNGRDVAEGAEVPKGSRIDLVVGDGLGNQEFEVPNLIGKPQEEASLLLSGSGLQVGSVIFEEHADTTQGLVIKQKPAAGTKIRVGDVVDIWVIGTDPAKSAPAVD
jgi:beta-lactam-binding protein with PASTA domain